jgi:hypothetical protein
VTLRADVASVLEAMGYVPMQDFRAVQEASGVRVDWLSAQAMPSEATINNFDLPAALLQQLYLKAKALLTADDPISKKEKAVLLVILDEFNAHATKINAMLTAWDQTTFAAARTAMLAITDYPQRTAAQIKTAVQNKIDAGQADG